MANSFPTSRDGAVLDGWRLCVCVHVRCVLKGLNKGRKSFHAPSASHQLVDAPSWGPRDSPPLPPSLFQIYEMNGDLRALFYPEGCVYTCRESQLGGRELVSELSIFPDGVGSRFRLQCPLHPPLPSLPRGRLLATFSRVEHSPGYFGVA